jgi:hypothetical protein
LCCSSPVDWDLKVRYYEPLLDRFMWPKTYSQPNLRLGQPYLPGAIMHSATLNIIVTPDSFMMGPLRQWKNDTYTKLLLTWGACIRM